ncbi:MAG: amidase [Pseudomonadota bacterium]
MTEPTFTGPEACRMTAREAVGVLKAGEVSPTELLEASWARMDQVEPEVNATVIRQDDRARAALAALPEREAENSGHRGWLAGLPIGIKDLIAVKGMRATGGSPATADFVPDESDALVERLEARGGIIAGKTNTPEWGAGANTFNAVFGRTRNPWNTARNAGGSSGGAAVSLATGEVWLSHGSDLAGSLRTPAAYCGVVGLRPSPGRCGGGPPAAAFSIEGIQGPMARNIGDLALFLDAMAGYDPSHPISLEEPGVGFQDALDAVSGPIRIAFSEDQGGFAPVEPEIRAVMRQALEGIAGDDLVVEETCPELPDLAETYVSLRGVHYGSVTDRLPDEIKAHFKDTLRKNAEFGRMLTSDAIYDAMRQRTVLYHIMRGFLTRFDVLAIPVVGLPPGPVEEEYPRVVDNVAQVDYIDWLKFSFLATTCALPALSLPCGFTADGMPVGLQLVGPPRGEARLLQVAAEVERRFALDMGPIDPVPAGL